MRLPALPPARRPGRLAATCLLVAGLTGVGVVPDAAASAPAETFSAMTMVSPPGGAGPLLWRSGVDAFDVVQGDTESVHIEVDGGETGGGFTVSLSAPLGESLRPGTYADVVPHDLRQGSQGGFLVQGTQVCFGTGRFEVLDLAFDQGRVSRLHARYAITCDDPFVQPRIGEILLNQPRPAGDLLVLPRAVELPRTLVGAAPYSVRASVVNHGLTPLVPGTPVVTGPDAASFTVEPGTCAQPVNGGGTCAADVRFAPSRSGGHSATLVFPGAPDQPVPLRGEGDQSRSSWRTFSEPGDPIGGGVAREWAASTATVVPTGGAYSLRLGLHLPGQYGPAAIAEFAGAQGQPLRAGQSYTYDPGDLYDPYDPDDPSDPMDPYPAWGPQMSISRMTTDGGRRCQREAARFTVHELEGAPSGGLNRVSISFEQRCVGASGALRGTVEYRAAEPAPPVTLDAAAMRPWFTDIAGTTHERGVALLAREGSARGHGDGTYRPQQSLTRGQQASLLARALRLPPAETPSGLRDTAGTAHAAAIDAVVQAGVARGHADGTFRPEATVTRGQTATMLAAALQLPDAPAVGFSDTTEDAHARDIGALAAAGIGGEDGDGSYRPLQPFSRGQLASALSTGLALHP